MARRAGRGFLLQPNRPSFSRPSKYYAPPPVNLSVTTADIAVAANAPSGSPFLPGIAFTFDTAEIAVFSEVDGVSLELGAPAISLAFDPAVVGVNGNAIGLLIGAALLPGETVSNAIPFNGTGTNTWSWGGYGVDATDTTLGYPSSTASIWFRYEPGATSLLSIVCSGTGEVQVFSFTDENDLSTWSLDGTSPADGTSTLSIGVSKDVPLYVRVEPTTPTSATISFDYIAYDSDILLSVDKTVFQTPSTIRVGVAGAFSDAVVEFYLYGNATPLYIEDTDTTGQIVGLSIPLPALPVGTHTIQALVIQPGEDVYVQKSFDVLTAPPTRPTTLPANVAPTIAPSSVTQKGVRKWVLQDKGSGGVEYIFPVNPSDMGTPHAAGVVSIENTTAGSPILWEAGVAALDWEFSGYCTSSTFYAALESFLALRHRFWLIDHRNRAWAVSFTKIEWTPKRVTPHNDWSFEYAVTAQVYEGPVTPT